MAIYSTAQDYFYDQIYLPMVEAFKEGNEKEFIELLRFAGHKFVETNAFAKAQEDYAREKGYELDHLDMPIADFTKKYVAPYMEQKEWEECETIYSKVEKERAEHDFGYALAQLKSGRKVARIGWNGKGQFVYYIPADRYEAKTEAAKSVADEDGKVNYRAYLALKTAQGDIATWVPSISDCLAEDWVVVD